MTHAPAETSAAALLSVAVIVAAACVGAGASAAGIAHGAVNPPYDALTEHLDTTLSILGNNALVASWPFALIAVRWHRIRGAALLGDVLVAAQLISHGYFVGAAVAAAPELWRFLPHLPVEWFGLALPAAAWWRARRLRAATRETVVLAGASAAALVVAALLETYAVPVT